MNFFSSTLLLYFLSTVLISNFAFAKKAKTETYSRFSYSKKYLAEHLDLFESKTIYCGCTVKGKEIDLKSCGYKVQKDAKRAARLEWEHVVPAEAFGQSFKEWREGDPKCRKKGKNFKGRKCAAINSEYSSMEGDLYNLFPEVGELNGLRSNYSMAEIPGPSGKFGKCTAKLSKRKFEPQDSAKGIVARTYLNFHHHYPGRGIISEKNEKLFEAWNKLYPITDLECRRWKALAPQQGYKHLFSALCM